MRDFLSIRHIAYLENARFERRLGVEFDYPTQRVILAHQGNSPD